MGVIAFWLIMLAVSMLSMWWLNGKLPRIIEKNRTASAKGRIVRLSFGKRSITFRMGRDFWIRLLYIALGPSAIIGLSLAYAEILPLGLVFGAFVLPSYIIMLVVGILFPEWGRRAAVGFTAGIIATIVYDIVRLALTYSLGLVDPIPHIGLMLVGPKLYFTGDYWWIGYLWRFFGNGAGMGIVYAMLSNWWFNMKGGWIYGEIVGMGMFALLLLLPVSQLHLFVLNGIVVVNGILGHWAYGMTLGWIFKRTKLKDKFPNHVLRSRPLTWPKKKV